MFRDLPEKYQWLAYILSINDNNWLERYVSFNL